jgi:MATE family multidrug resistance protein
MALDPIVAQAVGARDTVGVARGMQRGLLLATGITAFTILLLLPAESMFRLFGQPADVVPRAGAFVRISTASLPAFYAWVALRQSLQAMGRMRPIVTAIVVANLVNAAMCWLFVFGHAGPWRGVTGAAVATTIARWSMVLMLLAFAWRELAPSLVPFRRESFAIRPLARMLWVGIPIGVQYVLEFWVFGVVALLMGRLGTIPMAGHQIAINIASLTFMVPLGVSGAAAVLVGRAIGAGDPAQARRSAIAALGLGFTFMGLSGVVLGLLPQLLARVYTHDPTVIAMAVMLIPIAGVFQIFDGLQVVALGVLRGTGDTRTPMIVNMFGFWLIGFPISLWLGFGTGAGPVGLWWGFVAGLAAVAVFLLLRVRTRMAATIDRLVIDEEYDYSRSATSVPSRPPANTSPSPSAGEPGNP